jgi:hypothetical protein
MEEQDSPKVVLKGALKDIFRELVRFLRWLIAGLIDAGFLAMVGPIVKTTDGRK